MISRAAGITDAQDSNSRVKRPSVSNNREEKTLKNSKKFKTLKSRKFDAA
jgi:hypothetical protein